MRPAKLGREPRGEHKNSGEIIVSANKHLSEGLYRPSFEKDSCGFGLIAQMDGKASHWLVQTAINSLACLTHRGAVAADQKTGDGCQFSY